MNSVEEVKSYVKTQANCRNFKASVGKGSGGGKYPVLEMVCSRSGFSAKNAALLKGESYNPKKKKSKHQNSPTKTDSFLLSQLTKRRERKSSSFKCGCEWKISFSFSKSISGSGFMCTVLSVYLRHTNGCIPTPLQYSIAKQRIGDGLFKVPKPLAVTLHILFRSRGFHNSTVKELLREHGVVQRDEVVTGMMITNLRMKLGTLDADHTKWKEDNLTVSREFNIDFGCSHEDGMDSAACKIQIEKFASEYVKSHLNEDGASVVNLLATIKEEYVGFEFRIARISSKELTGWMFMTAEMQYMAAKYAQVVFLDAVKSKVSAVDWPFYPVAVVDEENKLYVIAFCLCVQESNDAYTWILKSIKSIVPSFQHIVKVTMSDRLVSDHVMHDALCLHLAGMCNWHLRERNLAEWVSKHPFKKKF